MLKEKKLTKKNTLSSKTVIQKWRRDKHFERQTKAYGVPHITRNAEMYSPRKNEKILISNMKTHENIKCTSESIYIYSNSEYSNTVIWWNVNHLTLV